MIALDDVRVAIQNVEVLRGFSLRVAPGTLVGLIGRNGAGKTTVMRTVMGHLPLLAGRVTLGGQDLARVPPHRRAALGIGYMPEDRGLVPELTVEENIALPVWVSRELVLRDRLAMVYGILPELLEMRDRKALLLSGGQQKLVALARALAVGTRLLLLDEPFEGVAPALSQRLSEVVGQLRGSGLTVVISQSDLNHSRRLLDEEVVIERGANVTTEAAA
ncbi:ATP-binding cassette domain-containing protein [Ramlibacter sp. USB13]|uniref:ATP-binding cassette domain-containing protein n=1 Tax=Ramlibacter cellulosilyticus TaxID=2764187 RepID=A0A923MVX6_9BURK|nr:ATP-binding cassette domain-containing protein [Ramlibacter cellulosilyticus]MBC5786061.1 ATP-binding cassette domain-containing protein [Ramlibacter cellulosilyticus]